jgi:hypothetical protein
VWARVVAVASAWNASEPATRVDDSVPGMLLVRFTEADVVGKDSLLAKLDAVAGAAIQVVQLSEFDAADYATADFVAVAGTPMDAVLNEPAALVDAGPCALCGKHDVLDVDQVAPFVIDEARIAREAPGLAVDLAGRGVAVTSAQADAWAAAGLRGADFRPVLEAATGRPSDRYVQLAATTKVLLPCPRHTAVVGRSHCPECGRANGRVDGWFTVPRDVAGRLDVMSRHPNRIAFLLLSRRALDVLQAIGPTGLDPYDALRLCD